MLLHSFLFNKRPTSKVGFREFLSQSFYLHYNSKELPTIIFVDAGFRMQDGQEGWTASTAPFFEIEDKSMSLFEFVQASQFCGDGLLSHPTCTHWICIAVELCNESLPTYNKFHHVLCSVQHRPMLPRSSCWPANDAKIFQVYALKLVGNLAATVVIFCVLIEPSSKRRWNGARNLATVRIKWRTDVPRHQTRKFHISWHASQHTMAPHGRTCREDTRLRHSFDLTQSRDCSFPAGLISFFPVGMQQIKLTPDWLHLHVSYIKI